MGEERGESFDRNEWERREERGSAEVSGRGERKEREKDEKRE